MRVGRNLGVAAVIACVLLVGACGALQVALRVGGDPVLAGAEALAERVLPEGSSSLDLIDRRALGRSEDAGGFVWRLGQRPGGSMGGNRRPTHLGVMVCVRREAATAAARFSYLRWRPRGCRAGQPVLDRLQTSVQQDARRYGRAIPPPGPLARSDELEHAEGRPDSLSPPG